MLILKKKIIMCHLGEGLPDNGNMISPPILRCLFTAKNSVHISLINLIYLKTTVKL